MANKGAGQPVECMTKDKCANCKDYLWVCEDHHDVPFDGNNNCCGGAGMPCLVCNPCDRENPPKMPDDFRIILDKDGWRH